MVRFAHVAVGFVILAVVPAQQVPVFRSGTVLVPIDVRVIDRRTHKPVTDLRQDEFIVTENKVRQQITLFSAQALTADASAVSSPLLSADMAATSLTPQTRRTFLIVLGRGRLQTWSQAVDGVLHLIRDRLLPQDYVAVMAFNRATDFTTDHERIAAVVERFRKGGDMADVQLKLFYQSAGLLAGADIPKPIQARIDAIFNGPDNSPIRTVPDAQVTNGARVANDQRQIADTLRTRERNAALRNATGDPNAAGGADAFLPEPLTAAANGIEMSFDDYVSVSTQTSDDLAKLYGGIAYLRYVDGEKHMIFVTERGVMLPRAEDDDSLAAAAADARVVIDVLHTGGAIAAADITSARGTGPGSRTPGDWRVSSSRAVALQTGGKFALSQTGKEFVDQLDVATRFSYLLGYYPTNPNWDGAYRKVTVTVNRPGAFEIQFRHGYMANLELKPLDKPKALAYARVAAAASTPDPITDIVVTATAVNSTDSSGSWVDVTVTLRPEQLDFSEKHGTKQALVDVAIFCTDDTEHLLGERWTTSDLTPAREALAKLQAAGLTYSTRVKVTSPARVVKVVVYDRGADALGSNTLKLELPKVKK